MEKKNPQLFPSHSRKGAWRGLWAFPETADPRDTRGRRAGPTARPASPGIFSGTSSPVTVSVKIRWQSSGPARPIQLNVDCAASFLFALCYMQAAPWYAISESVELRGLNTSRDVRGPCAGAIPQM
jgi:hypothetical protein